MTHWEEEPGGGWSSRVCRGRVNGEVVLGETKVESTVSRRRR